MTKELTTRIPGPRAVALVAALTAVASMLGHTTPVLAATAVEYGLIVAL